MTGGRFALFLIFCARLLAEGCVAHARVRFWFKVNDALNYGIKFRNRYFRMKSATYVLHRIR